MARWASSFCPSMPLLRNGPCPNYLEFSVYPTFTVNKSHSIHHSHACNHHDHDCDIRNNPKQPSKNHDLQTTTLPQERSCPAPTATQVANARARPPERATRARRRRSVHRRAPPSGSRLVRALRERLPSRLLPLSPHSPSSRTPWPTSRPT